jgi:Gas vesicle protein K
VAKRRPRSDRVKRASPKERRDRSGAHRPVTPQQRRNRAVAHGPATPKQRRNRVVAKAGGLTVTEIAEIRQLRRQLEKTAAMRSPLRWNADPDEVQRSVAQLVLTLVEFIRKLLERQTIRRMETRTLTDAQVENVGRALMQLEQTVYQIGATFGLRPEDLNLDLGPAGKLM